jgi:hypothetical protein
VGILVVEGEDGHGDGKGRGKVRRGVEALMMT